MKYKLELFFNFLFEIIIVDGNILNQKSFHLFADTNFFVFNLDFSLDFSILRHPGH